MIRRCVADDESVGRSAKRSAVYAKISGCEKELTSISYEIEIYNVTRRFYRTNDARIFRVEIFHKENCQRTVVIHRAIVLKSLQRHRLLRIIEKRRIFIYSSTNT